MKKTIVSLYFKLFFITLTFFMITNSCEKDVKNRHETISFDLKTGGDNCEVKIKSVIKLETNDSSLIGKITKIVFFKNRFFVLDRMISKTLFVFDSNGKFIAKTIRGKGPQECIEPWDFMIDSITSTIKLWDQSSYKMIEYDLNLNYINADHHDGLSLVNSEYITKDILLVFAQNSENRSDYFNYSIYNSNFSEILNRLIPTSNKFIGLTLNSPICKTKRVIFTAPFDNNIYQINKTQAKIIYNLNFGNLNVTEEDKEKGITYVFQCAKNGMKITSVDNLHENDKYLTFSFFYNNRLNFLIHSKITKKNYYSETSFLERKLPRCLIMGISGDANFLAYSESNEIRKFVFKDIINQKIQNTASELDNPYIIIFNLQND